MPFTLDQLEFLGVHTGLVVPPEFIENKKRQVEFKQRREQFLADHPDLDGRHNAPEIKNALADADKLAQAGKSFAEALERLGHAETMAKMQPPPPPAATDEAVKARFASLLKAHAGFENRTDFPAIDAVFRRANHHGQSGEFEAALTALDEAEALLKKPAPSQEEAMKTFTAALHKMIGKYPDYRMRPDGKAIADKLQEADWHAGKGGFESAYKTLDLAEALLAAPPKLDVPVQPGQPDAPKPAVAPVPQPAKDEEDDALPPPPNVPPPTIPKAAAPVDPLDAINALLQESRTAQETIRQAADELLAIQDGYLNLQGDRAEAANPSDAFNDLTAQMAQAIENFKAANARADRAMTRLLRLEQDLKAVDINAPNTPASAVKLHAKATVELTDRVKKGLATRDQGTKTEAALIKAFSDKVNFTAREGVKVYDPDLFELPSLLRDLTARLLTTTQQFRDARQQLAPDLQRANELLEVASKGKPLPNTAANEIAGFQAKAEDLSKKFGKWNAAINNPWKGASAKVKGLKKEDHLETIELFWRGEKLYDEFAFAYGAADETAKNLLHLVKLLNSANAVAPASSTDANKELAAQIQSINKIREIIKDPIGRLNDAKGVVAEKKKQLAKIDAGKLPVLESALTDLNQDIEKVRANLQALERATQEAGIVEGLIKTRFSAKGVDKKQVETLKKGSAAIEKSVSPAAKEGAKTEAAMVALRDELFAKRAALGKAASVEDTVRLQSALKELPPLAGKDQLFPAKGVSQWKGDTSKGGDKKATTLFAAVVKAWEAAEKSADNKALDALDAAAAGFLTHFAALSQDGAPDAADTKRADKCREAQRLVRRMRLKNERDSLPEPPWTEAQATKAKQLEACSLLESGTPAKAPSAKGESDSFFIKNGDGKPAFIFKPKQGENVKEDLGGKEGEGVVREVLTSKFNDQMKEMIGVDFGVCPTGIARLESDSFANGEKSKEKSRVGALQAAAPNEGSLLDKLTDDPAFAKQVKKEDVQKVAMMDFLTLQGDRNAGNLLIQDVNGEKRMVPIDGGFAFPSKELFGMASSGMAGQPMDVNAPPPTNDQERTKAKGNFEGKNALMLLPQSEEKFSEEMLKSIDALDPNELVKGLKKSNAEIAAAAPEVDGLVGDENIENVRRSALFLKKAAREFTVAELAEIYALDFKRVLAVPAKQVDKEIAAVIAQGKKRSAFNKSKKAADTEFQQLGGDAELIKLGWDPKADRMLRLNFKRKLEILKKHEAAPVVAPQPTTPKPQKDQAELERELKSLGGDKELAKVLGRKDGNSPNLGKNPSLIGKVARLRTWKEFNDLGGDKGFASVVTMFQDNQYTPFDQLPKRAQAAVATFASWSGDPYELPLGSKADALRDFKKYSK